MGSPNKPKASMVSGGDQAQPDLFSGATTHEDGYARWRAEQRKKKLAAQGSDLPASDHGEGYAAWRAEMQRHRDTVEKRFGVPLGHRVWVQLVDELKPLEGLLCLVEERQGSRAKGLRLRVGDRTFGFNQIESVVAVG